MSTTSTSPPKRSERPDVSSRPPKPAPRTTTRTPGPYPVPVSAPATNAVRSTARRLAELGRRKRSDSRAVDAQVRSVLRGRAGWERDDAGGSVLSHGAGPDTG